MRVRNKMKISVFYPFAGVAGGKMLKAGGRSPKLPSERYYDPLLQRALAKGLIAVEFDAKDVGVIGAAGIPGPVAKVLSVLDPKPDSSPASSVVTKPEPRKDSDKPVVVVSEDPPPRPKKRKVGRVENASDGPIRASALAKELKIPFHVLSAAIQKKTGKPAYPVTSISADVADAMRDIYAEKLDIPEVADTPSVSRGEVRTLSDLSDDSDGIVSLADLEDENRKGGAP